MNFDFSRDQKELQGFVRQFFAGQNPLTEVRRILEGQAPYSEAVWRQMADLGYLGVSAPESYGGLGLGHLELCLVAEEVGRSLAAVPFSSLAFAMELFSLADNRAQSERWLADMVKGTAIPCVAFHQPGQASHVHAGEATFDSGTITGIKSPVLDGGIADFAVVLCSSPNHSGRLLAIVDLNDPGVTRESLITVDPSRNSARLVFNAARAELLCEAGKEVFTEAINRAAIITAFEQVGGADRILELTRDYTLQRYAFGRKIGSFQAVKHKLVDMHVKNTLARGHAYFGAWALATGSEKVPLAAAAARTSASEAFNFSAQESIQVHGGIGFTWEHDCQLFLKRARLLGGELGSFHEWKERLVVLLEQQIQD